LWYSWLSQVLRLQAATDGDSYVGACSDIDTATLGRYAAELNRPRKEPA
jgi:hypothetical protein